MCVHRTMPKGLLGNGTYKAQSPVSSRAPEVVVSELKASGFRCLADEEPSFARMVINFLSRIAKSVKSAK